jgi:aminoglycoside 3-N-acetyltransferase
MARSAADEHRQPVPEPPGLAVDALVRGFRALGVRAGQTLLVHGSLGSLGWVDGGAATVVAALREAVTPTGTVVAFTGTEENSNTSRAHHARIAGMTPEQVAQFRNRMPAFDRRSSVTGAGRLAEELRTTPGAVRSAHPQSSFAALGPRAAELMGGHALSCHHGERSPLARLYEVDAAADGPPLARVLLLGVGYRACTAFHLAEYRYRSLPPSRIYSCVTRVGGRRRWTVYRDAVLDDSDFELIGARLDEDLIGDHGYVGQAPCRLMPFRAVVDHAAKWMLDLRT